MTNNLNKPFYYAFLLLGLLMLPFLGFSQQEQPKRVTVVVTAKEIAPSKQVVQLPADNIPTTINGRPKTTVKKKFPAYSVVKPKAAPSALVQPKKTIAASPKVTNSVPIPKEKAIAKENTVVKTSAKTKNPAPAVVKADPIKKAEVVAKPKTAPQPKKEMKAAEKEIASPAPITTAASPSTDHKIEEPTSSIDNETMVKADRNKDTPQLSPDGQKNATSYIWIGVFLIIAGVVLGLLFGKPAFLISFVGVVFVALGMII